MNSPTAPHIMFIAGEASGDAHGAAAVRELAELLPEARISAMGSSELKKAGADVFFDSAGIAVVGIVEVLKHWGEIKQAMELVKQRLETDRPDLLVLIDYQEFNLKIARHAKALGIKVLFYISPQVWAWRPKRIHKIGAAIDHMAVLFKFEEDYYHRAGIPVTFVGNPLVDKVHTDVSTEQERERLGVAEGERVIGLFPGSRRSEIERLLPVMLESAHLMQTKEPTLKFVLPVAATLDRSAIEQQCQDAGVSVTLTTDNFYDVTASCDAIVCCSGTVTLEIALLGIPMCIIYRMSWLSYQIMSRLITIPNIGLANIVAGKKVVRELLQDDANPNTIRDELFRLLNDQQHRSEVIEGLSKVRENLGKGDGSRNLAKLICELIADNTRATP
jgi:lipid-A-disaccharide synthase